MGCTRGRKTVSLVVGGGGGIGWGLTKTMDGAEVNDEVIIDAKVYHTIKEVKNGQGPPPIKTEQGWLHLGHGVRNIAAGLRYVLYLFLTELERPWIVTHMPAGHFIAPMGRERVGDVLNDHKQIYAQAFALYAFAQYHKVTKNAGAKKKTGMFFHLIERHSRLRERGVSQCI